MVSNQTRAEQATQDSIYERPVDYLPERDVYESLCRGEGVKLVRPVGGSGAQAVHLGCDSGQADFGGMFCPQMLESRLLSIIFPSSL